MPSHYKTKATAIKHILAGESFWTAKFKNFWEDKEVVKEAVILNPYVFDHPKCEVKNEWRWDEEFTNEIFERSKCPHPFGFNGSRYLSSSFTSNRKKVLKALKDGKSEVCLYMDEAFYSDPAIIMAMPTAFGKAATVIAEMKPIKAMPTAFGKAATVIAEMKPIKATPTAFGEPCYIDWPMGLCLDRSTNRLQLFFTEDCNQSPSSFRFANQLKQNERASLDFWTQDISTLAPICASYDIRKFIGLSQELPWQAIESMKRIRDYNSLIHKLSSKSHSRELEKI